MPGPGTSQGLRPGGSGFGRGCDLTGVGLGGGLDLTDDRTRIAIGAVLFEGNSFSAVRADLETFKRGYLVTGSDVIGGLEHSATEMAGAISACRAAGAEIVPTLATHGGAGGRVSAAAFATLKEGLLSRLREALPVDGIYLALHGAMLCDDGDDPEGDLLAAVRRIAGSVPIVVSCDLHAHVTTRMLDNATALIGYQHYPHEDTFETGQRAIDLLLRTIDGAVRPVMAMRKLAAIFPPVACGTMVPGPMRDIYHDCRAIEARGEALSASYFPVQAWLDLQTAGTAAVVVTDGDGAAAKALAERLVGRIWAGRHDIAVPLLSPADAFSAGLTTDDAPIVLCECADAPGAGAAGDSAALLRAYKRAAPRSRMAMTIVDPEVVTRGRESGIGGCVSGVIGHAIDPAFGAPMSYRGTVRTIIEGTFDYRGGLFGGVRADMGPSIVLRIDEADVLVTSKSFYEHHDEHFIAAGIDVRAQKFIVVKNHMNFRNGYAWAPRMIVVDTAGAASANLRDLPWTARDRQCFPFEDSPQPYVLETWPEGEG